MGEMKGMVRSLQKHTDLRVIGIAALHEYTNEL